MAKPQNFKVQLSSEGELRSAPICPDWVISGSPQAYINEFAKSLDKTLTFIAWDCSAGVFDWHYDDDEMLVVIEGEAFLTGEDGVERRIGPGDTVYFPTGSSCHWRVPNRVRKIAFMRKSLPAPLSFAWRAWHRLAAMLGRGGRSGFGQEPGEAAVAGESQRRVASGRLVPPISADR
jgi:hypothetical protein